METMTLVLALSATFVLSGAAAWLVANGVVPWLVRCLGPQRYADPWGLDGCAQIVFVAGASAAGALLLHTFRVPFPDYAILPAAALLPAQLVYNLVLLRWIGHAQSHQEFAFDGSKIRALRTGEVLDVLCVHRETHYRQADAYRGFAWYTATVRTRDGRTFANGFTVRDEWERAGEALLAYGPALDLNFVCVKAPGVWQAVSMSDAWLPLLAGQTDRLPPDSRDFWMSLLRPRFGASEERSVDVASLQAHVAALRDAFGSVVEDDLRRLERFAHGRAGPPIAMTEAQFQATLRRGVPKARVLLRNEDGIAHHYLHVPGQSGRDKVDAPSV